MSKAFLEIAKIDTSLFPPLQKIFSDESNPEKFTIRKYSREEIAKYQYSHTKELTWVKLPKRYSSTKEMKTAYKSYLKSGYAIREHIHDDSSNMVQSCRANIRYGKIIISNDLELFFKSQGNELEDNPVKRKAARDKMARKMDEKIQKEITRKLKRR